MHTHIIARPRHAPKGFRFSCAQMTKSLGLAMPFSSGVVLFLLLFEALRIASPEARSVELGPHLLFQLAGLLRLVFREVFVQRGPGPGSGPRKIIGPVIQESLVFLVLLLQQASLPLVHGLPHEAGGDLVGGEHNHVHHRARYTAAHGGARRRCISCDLASAPALPARDRRGAP